MPQDTTQVDILVDSLDLLLIPYPYDQDLTDDEIQAHFDANEEGFTWQYCLVEADFPMPTEVESELLAYIYYQPEEEEDEDGEILTRSGAEDQLSPEVYEAVFDKSLELTGRDTSPGTRAERWYPSAHITYTDEFGTTTNLQNVRVVVTNNASIPLSGYTKSDGWAHITNFGGKGFVDDLKYSISWKSGKWKIKNNKGTAIAKYYKPGGRNREEWICNIRDDWNNKYAMYASIHRALNAYYHESHLKTSGLTKMNHINIRARWNEKNEEGANGFFGSWRINKIHIFSRNSSGPRTNRAMLSTTFHELGHASHYYHIDEVLDWNKNTYFHDVNLNLADTWARGVQYAYMSSLYPNNFADVIDYFGNYTAVVESLMNQGVTLKQLQTIMMGKTNLGQCRQPVKNLGIVYDEIVDIIFDNPQTPVRINMNDLITGQDNPKTNTLVQYSVPTATSTPRLPTGVTFTGWDIAGGAHTMMSLRTNPTLSISFQEAGQYTLTANFRLPDDTPGDNSDNPTHSVSKEIEVNSFTIGINGQYRWQQNSFTTYTVPSLPAGVTFRGWNISPDTYTTSNGTAGTSLEIKFTATGQYTLAANFTLFDGTPYTATRTVTVGSAVETPIISPPALLMSQGINPAPGPTQIRWNISVDNYYGYMTYEWRKNGEIQPQTGAIMTVIAGEIPVGAEWRIQCRARNGNEVSGWSNTLLASRSGIREGDDYIQAIFPPVIHADKTTAQNGETVVFSVEWGSGNYEWEMNGAIVPGETGRSVSLPMTAVRQTGAGGLSISSYGMSVRCRKASPGQTPSDWSEPVVVRLSLTGIGGGGVRDTTGTFPPVVRWP